MGALLWLLGGGAGLAAQEGSSTPADGGATGLPESSPSATPEVREITLEEALETAQVRSPILDQARANVQTAEAQQLSSWGGYLPDVSLGYGYSRSSGSGRLDPTGQTITNQSYSSQLRSSLTLFDGFRRERDLESARLGVEAAETDYEARRFDALLQVKTAFYNAVAGQDRVTVEEERLARQEEQLDFVRQQIRLGRATRSDTLRTRVDLNSARLALLEAENQARAAEFSLAEAMGVTERVRPVPEATLETAPLSLDREELIRIAVDRAPSVRTAELDVAAADAGVSAARSTYWPSLSVSGGMDWRNNTFPPGNGSWSLSVSGSIPVFNGFQRETGVDRAQAQAYQARAQRRAAELTVRSEIQNAYDQIETALAGLDLADESLEAAEEDLRVTQQRYRLGVATTLDLRSAEIALRQAEVDRIRRRFDYQVGVARLESLLGTELDEVQVAATTERGSPAGTESVDAEDADAGAGR
ncbi:MAG: TolC family protein [Longimicrobiales bacterium]|nr:TolC family protein [Longimicrobiales bacterium]